jgi:hypothetical protein
MISRIIKAEACVIHRSRSKTELDSTNRDLDYARYFSKYWTASGLGNHVHSVQSVA